MKLEVGVAVGAREGAMVGTLVGGLVGLPGLQQVRRVAARAEAVGRVVAGRELACAPAQAERRRGRPGELGLVLKLGHVLREAVLEGGRRARVVQSQAAASARGEEGRGEESGSRPPPRDHASRHVHALLPTLLLLLLLLPRDMAVVSDKGRGRGQGQEGKQQEGLHRRVSFRFVSFRFGLTFNQCQLMVIT